MDLRNLATFVTVAETGNFSRAADQLNLAQPAVSQRVGALERDLGTRLLDRSTRRVELTEAGRHLLSRARSILAEVDRARDEVRLLEAGHAGQVSIGFVGTATYSLLPQLARRVRSRLPLISLDLYGEQLTPQLINGLLTRQIDLGFVRSPVARPELTIHTLRSERLVAVVPSDSPWAHRDKIALSELSEASFVTYPSAHRSVMYDATLQACDRAGFTPHNLIEVRETATLVTFVAAGLGVALVPEPVQSLALDYVTYLPLSDTDLTTDLALVGRVDDACPAVRRVSQLIVSESAWHTVAPIGRAQRSQEAEPT
jgi:DNA-binding transcriptional LysR family regulator